MIINQKDEQQQQQPLDVNPTIQNQQRRPTPVFDFFERILARARTIRPQAQVLTPPISPQQLQQPMHTRPWRPWGQTHSPSPINPIYTPQYPTPRTPSPMKPPKAYSSPRSCNTQCSSPCTSITHISGYSVGQVSPSLSSRSGRQQSLSPEEEELLSDIFGSRTVAPDSRIIGFGCEAKVGGFNLLDESRMIIQAKKLRTNHNKNRHPLIPCKDILNENIKLRDRICPLHGERTFA